MWLYKHLVERPSIIVVFFQLEWDDPQWEVKEQRCSEYLIEIKKRHAKSSNSTSVRVVVVLIQTKGQGTLRFTLCPNPNPKEQKNNH